MFSNLNQGSILYVLDTRNKLKLTTGTINTITPPRPKLATFNPMGSYGQSIETVVDITATIDGEKREFKQIPATASTANFGSDAFMLADSRDSMLGHVNAMLQNSKSIVNSVEKHKQLIQDYQNILVELNPSLAAEANRDNAIVTLQQQMGTITTEFADLKTALNKILTSFNNENVKK